MMEVSCLMLFDLDRFNLSLEAKVEKEINDRKSTLIKFLTIKIVKGGVVNFFIRKLVLITALIIAPRLK